MVELDYDQVLEELQNIEEQQKQDSSDLPGYPEILDRYLETVAKNGDIIFPWSKVKPFMRRKLELVMDAFYKENPLTETQIRVPNCKPFDYSDLKGEIMKSFDWFYAAPFTIQRLCELLIDPGKHYRRTDKFMRGIEKNVLVVSTVQPRPNKYATSETSPEKQQANFKDLYPHFNSSPMHNNHSSSTSSASGSSSPSGVLNGSLEASGASGSHGPNNSYDGANSSAYHPLANTFYDQAPQPPSSLNNHHHHHQHLLDTMNDGSAHGMQIPHPHANSHHPPQSPHHVPPHHPHAHSSPLAPLQQLDSFTNVFANTTANAHHHLTHLSAANYGGGSPLDSTNHQMTNGSAGGWSQDSLKQSHHGSSPYDSLLSQTAASHHNDHLNNDDNENIVVDDDEEEDSKAGGGPGDEKDPFFYSTDSSNSNSNTSDSSSHNSDSNSNDKDDQMVVTTELLPGESEGTTALNQPNLSSDDIGDRIGQELSHKKRLSPTPPPPPAPSTDAPSDEPMESSEDLSIKDETEPPLTPKKLRVQDE